MNIVRRKSLERRKGVEGVIGAKKREITLGEMTLKQINRARGSHHPSTPSKKQPSPKYKMNAGQSLSIISQPLTRRATKLGCSALRTSPRPEAHKRSTCLGTPGRGPLNWSLAGVPSNRNAEGILADDLWRPNWNCGMLQKRTVSAVGARGPGGNCQTGVRGT